MNTENTELSFPDQIDNIIANTSGWRGELLARLRTIIHEADREMTEEVKWKKPSKPEGVPVWSHNGIMCVADTLKNAVRLTFPNGAQLDDPNGVFNTRLDSNKVRAVDYFEDSNIDESGLRKLIRATAAFNELKAKR